MDIFNRKRVEGLEAEVRKLTRRRNELERNLMDARDRADLAEKRLAAMNEVIETVPEDCKPGKYCEGCMFAKQYIIRYWPRTSRYEFGLYCGKSESCKNFIQKGVKNE